MTRLLAAPALLALIALPPTLWPLAIFAVSVAAAMGLGAWAWVLRRRLAVTRAALATAVTALAERVDEIANADELVTRLAQENARLSGDVLAAQMLASDAREELAAAPAPVIPLPRRGSHDDLAALDAEATAYTWPAIAREAFPVREWGEEAEK